MLTDGHTYGDEKSCLSLSKEAGKEGISFNMLGIGHDWNHQLLEEIAANAGGNSAFITSPRELDQYIQVKLRNLESVYAHSLRLEFTSSPGIELRYAFRLNPDTGPLPISNNILLGDISYHKSIGVLLEFLIQPISKGVDRLDLAKGIIGMKLPNCPDLKVRMLVDFYREVQDNVVEESPPVSIVEALSRLTLYRMQEKASSEVNAGQVDKATRRLQFLATHLLSQGERDLAHIILVEAEHLKQNRQYSQDGDKRIKYGTRAFLLPAGLEHN